MYFTGNAHFNRSMRSFCKKHSYTLSDHGLCRCLCSAAPRSLAGGDDEFGEGPRPYVDTKKLVGASAVLFTEEEVFRALNLEYRAPHQREVVYEYEAREIMDGSGGACGDGGDAKESKHKHRHESDREEGDDDDDDDDDGGGI